MLKLSTQQQSNCMKLLRNYSSGINTVGFTTFSQGIHKFRLFDGKKNISAIKVTKFGSGYENRQLKS